MTTNWYEPGGPSTTTAAKIYPTGRCIQSTLSDGGGPVVGSPDSDLLLVSKGRSPVAATASLRSFGDQDAGCSLGAVDAVVTLARSVFVKSGYRLMQYDATCTKLSEFTLPPNGGKNVSVLYQDGAKTLLKAGRTWLRCFDDKRGCARLGHFPDDVFLGYGLNYRSGPDIRSSSTPYALVTVDDWTLAFNTSDLSFAGMIKNTPPYAENQNDEQFRVTGNLAYGTNFRQDRLFYYIMDANSFVYGIARQDYAEKELQISGREAIALARQLAGQLIATGWVELAGLVEQEYGSIPDLPPGLLPTTEQRRAIFGLEQPE